MFFTLQIFWNIFIKSQEMGVLSIIKSFILGGFGPGSYYIPLMIQLIIITPVLFFIEKKIIIIY